MSDMQWRKANGDTGEYTGPLVDLGSGIPRPMKDHGIRRALFDLAFGYVSGFPVRDVVPFAVRSLFPQQPADEVTVQAEVVEEAHVGTVHIQCPECGELMPATVSATITEDEDEDEDLRPVASLACTANMADIHAHMWTHA